MQDALDRVTYHSAETAETLDTTTFQLTNFLHLATIPVEKE